MRRKASTPAPRPRNWNVVCTWNKSDHIRQSYQWKTISAFFAFITYHLSLGNVTLTTPPPGTIYLSLAILAMIQLGYVPNMKCLQSSSIPEMGGGSKFKKSGSRDAGLLKKQFTCRWLVYLPRPIYKPEGSTLTCYRDRRPEISKSG